MDRTAKQQARSDAATRRAQQIAQDRHRRLENARVAREEQRIVDDFIGDVATYVGARREPRTRVRRTPLGDIPTLGGPDDLRHLFEPRPHGRPRPGDRAICGFVKRRPTTFLSDAAAQASGLRPLCPLEAEARGYVFREGRWARA